MQDSTPVKLRGRDKLSKIPVHVIQQAPLPKPDWLIRRFERVDFDATRRLQQHLRSRRLVTVCEEAACPNMVECFGQHGTATFMILGDVCTRRCGFCHVAFGRPTRVDAEEPSQLAEAVVEMGLEYVVITSVNRDDLPDGGAAHFAACIERIRTRTPKTLIEILVPDFRGRWPKALEALSGALPDVFNHNIETVPRFYPYARPGADYAHSLDVLASFKKKHPSIPTKSGFMVGLGESDDDICGLLDDLRGHHVDRVTMGQYLAPTPHHLPVQRYVPPESFAHYKKIALKIGFTAVESGPWVRSSYHAKLSHMPSEDLIA